MAYDKYCDRGQKHYTWKVIYALPPEVFLDYKNKSLTTVVRLSKSLYGVHLIISNMVEMSSVAIVTFDFSIRIFPPVII